jgi:hypothetical protein
VLDLTEKAEQDDFLAAHIMASIHQGDPEYDLNQETLLSSPE